MKVVYTSLFTKTRAYLGVDPAVHAPSPLLFEISSSFVNGVGWYFELC